MSSGVYFGEHGYFGKAEWTNDAWATVTEGTVVPSWLPDIGWAPLYQELTRVPLIVHAPGLVPGRREALTSAPDLTPTILEPTGVGPSAMQGESFLDVLVGSEDEHRPFVVSSWPLYFAAGEIITAVDSRPRRLSSCMPLTITTKDRALILGGPEDTPELYDLARDPREQTNVCNTRVREAKTLCEDVISFLEQQRTPDDLLKPRREALESFASGR